MIESIQIKMISYWTVYSQDRYISWTGRLSWWSRVPGMKVVEEADGIRVGESARGIILHESTQGLLPRMVS